MLPAPSGSVALNASEIAATKEEFDPVGSGSIHPAIPYIVRSSDGPYVSSPSSIGQSSIRHASKSQPDLKQPTDRSSRSILSRAQQRALVLNIMTSKQARFLPQEIVFRLRGKPHFQQRPALPSST